MGEWKEYEIADLITQKSLAIGDGYRAKHSELEATKDAGLPFARAGNIDGGFDFSDADFFPIEDLAKIGEKISMPGDTVFTSKGTVGRFAYVNDAAQPFVYSPQLCFWRSLDKDFIFPRFLFYWMQGKEFLAQVDAVKGQTDMADYVNLADQRQMKITLPELPEQHAIAGVLISLDDKIELLRRQNKTLEALAETLFRQWFVEHAEERLENGKTYKLGDLIDSISQTFKFTSDKVVFLNTSDIDSGQVMNHNLSGVSVLPGQAKKSIKENDILYSEIRPANRRYAFIDFDADNYVVSTKLMVLRAKPHISSAIIYFYLTHQQTLDWLQMLAEGRSGTFPQITFDQVKEMKINLPTDEALKEFTEWAESTLKKISKNNDQIRSLTRVRDALLPRLMSGAVRVVAN